MTSVGPVLFKIWSNYINSFLLCLLQTTLHFLSSGPIFLPKIPIDSGTFVVQTQSNYFFSTCFMRHAMRKKHFANISLRCEFTPPWNRANLLHSASSNSTRRYCHYSYSYWRWDSFTWTTWPGYLTIWVTVTFAGLYYQRHFQTCFYHCSKHVLLRHHVKGCSTDIILPTVCWRCCRLASSYRFLALHYQQTLWLFARCLIQLDLIDIYHRFM